MKDAFVEIQKLKSFETNFNKNCDLWKQLSKHDDTSYFADLKADIDNARTRDINIDRNELRSIYKPLKKIHEMASQSKLSDLDLASLKKDMIQIQDGIRNVKQTSKTTLDKLKSEENDLIKDLENLEQKLDQNVKVNVVPNRTIVHRSHETSSKLCPEVQKFNKFVSDSGGHENRWPLEDHSLFLKLRAKHKGEAELAKNLHKLLPDISEQGIVRHEMWYREYIHLKNKQQIAIKNWRQNRVEEIKKQSQAINVQTKAKIDDKKLPIINRDIVKQQLNIWKQNTKEKKNQEMLKEKKKEILKRKVNELKEKERQQEIKKQVELWKINKEEHKKKEKLEKERNELIMKELKSSKANKLIKTYQLQDKIFIDKMKFLKLRSNSLDPIERVDKIQVERDPLRLLKPTKQWLHRTSSYDGKNQSNVCFINSIQKLGIPEWRKAAK